MKDPVCGAWVDGDEYVASGEDKKRAYFCSKWCMDKHGLREKRKKARAEMKKNAAIFMALLLFGGSAFAMIVSSLDIFGIALLAVVLMLLVFWDYFEVWVKGFMLDRRNDRKVLKQNRG